MRLSDRFEILGVLGEGGMGVVHRALDRRIGEEIALKTLRVDSAESLLRLKDEFRSLQDLSHPNLVEYRELVELNGSWCLSMEIVDGVDILSYVRGEIAAGDNPFDCDTSPAADPSVPYRADRLRDALGQLVHALQQLHQVGKVHRDVKPSNVLVTDDGRVVLLDFGLVANLEQQSRWTGDNVVGTAAYMAPEQAASKTVTAASDWYSVGVILYEALVGRLPFEGASIRVLLEKQSRDPPPPDTVLPNVDAQLAALASALLRYEPRRRPSGNQVLLKLGDSSRRFRPAHASSSVADDAFFGRDAELQQLRDLVTNSRDAPTAAVVCGESGYGKSALLRRLSRTLGDSAVVLSGRCYERESVPFKAFDAVVDQLARYLKRLPPVDAARLLPRRAGLLRELFPVLQGVPSIAEAPVCVVPDPTGLRRLSFGALGELLGRLAEVRGLVLLIDDFQWADADSVALLHQILQPPDAPALCIVAAVRPTGDQIDALSQLPCEVARIDLPVLEPAEAEQLARTLLERSGAVSQVADDLAVTFARESRGVPLFLDELVRYAATARSAGAPTPVGMTLGEAIWTRVSELDDGARLALYLVCLAGGPLSLPALGDACRVDRASADRAASTLRVARLIRVRRQQHDVVALEPYHGRVRDSVLEHLDESARTSLHLRIARALQAASPRDDEALAYHFERAGELNEAASCALSAAAHASTALAFDRAARLYQQALALAALSPEATQRALIGSADALANSGRSYEAAQAYRAALAGANPTEAIELRRRTADQLLRGGHIDDGLDELRSLLDIVGLRFPATPGAALRSVIWQRVRMRMRGLGFRARHTAELSPAELNRIDTCWSAATCLSVVDVMRGAHFQASHLKLALQSGEPYRISRALVVEAAHRATGGERARRAFEPLIERAAELADQTGHPHARGMVALIRAITAMLAGGFHDGVPMTRRAEAIFAEECTGVSWELVTTRFWYLYGLFWRGHVRELCEVLPRIEQAAHATGDLYANANWADARSVALICGEPSDGDFDSLEHEFDSWSRTGYHVQHTYRLRSLIRCDLYRGDAKRARDRLLGDWPALRRSLLLRVQLATIQFLDLRARTAVAVAERERTPPTAELRDAARSAATLWRTGATWGRGLASLRRGAVRRLRGDDDGAAAQLERAIELLERAGLTMYAVAAKLRLGELRGGDDGSAMAAAAVRAMTREGVANPHKLAAVLAPGFGRP